jgi:hypothetical protein
MDSTAFDACCNDFYCAKNLNILDRSYRRYNELKRELKLRNSVAMAETE